MKNTHQTSGITVLQHGEMVWAKMEEFLIFLKGGKLNNPNEWRLPSWVIDYKKQILEKLLPESILREYAIHHDCGKPYCRTVDAEGRAHFPNHAQVSEETWLSIGGDG